MKKIFVLMFWVVGVMGISSCSTDTAMLDESTSLNSTASISSFSVTSEDLIGTWKIHTMVSDIPVDLDNNGTSSRDVLDESSCFDNMIFDFFADGSVRTTQARLAFDSTGQFSCNERTYSATYEVADNKLKVYFNVGGVSYSEIKEIAIVEEGNDQFLKITLSSYETDAAVYVSDDPGNTVASDIQKIEFTYIKL